MLRLQQPASSGHAVLRMVAWAPKDDLRQELDRSRAIRGQHGVARPEDPSEFGRRVARETFERYVKLRDGADDSELR